MSSFPLPSHVQADSALARQTLCVALATLLLFLCGVQGDAFVGFDSRFALFAKEMLRHGPGWFPTTYGEPYPDYPATSTWLIYLLSLPLGKVTSFTAWLPTALAAALCTGIVYRLVAPLSRSWALISVAMLLLTATFVSETRAISLDLMVAAVGLLAFLIAYDSARYSLPGLLVRLLPLLFVGFALRGPLGVVVPAGMVCCLLLLDRRWKALLLFCPSALALLIGCTLVLLALARVAGGEAFVQDVIHMQVTGRLDGTAGSSDVLYYFRSSLGNYALVFPLALPALLLLWKRRQEPAARLVAGCALAALVVMAGLSVPQAKKARYIIAMAPLAAIVAGYPFMVAGSRLAGVLRAVLRGLWLVFPVLLLAGLWFAWRRYPAELAGLGWRLPLCIALLAGLLVLAALRWRQPAVQALCAALALWGGYILVFEPVEHRLYDSQAFSAEVARQLEARPSSLVLYGMGKDAQAIKLMVNLDRDLQPQFPDTPQQLAALRGPLLLMVEERDLARLAAALPGLPDPLFSGRFSNDEYRLLRLEGAGTSP
ncbi:glycosyltransferase [Pseudomonas sp. CAN2814]|uniref:ArnT family glycosyltransferase n=1 Tax=Pseudomonas sp. CAN1 TaxID=3046726 RepID=UPI00264A28E2|nr:glycosyltransferase [Pseudomonas sp. CAN1]MDN6855695.1 glycosyltransferase [Pseudomonas sp. CAN1]